jgi:hypothetical protein
VKKKRRQFPRLAVYATSPAELRRALETVEHLAALVGDLATLIGVLRAEVDQLKAAVASTRPRRQRKETTHDPERANAAADGFPGK